MKKTLSLKNREISTEKPAFVMGIVNCTPDSFFSASRGGYRYALSLEKQGADILDLGAESTRPGSSYVSEKEEIKRLVPIIKAIRKRSAIPISVDTRKKAVLEAAVSEGADILNDISALEDDEKMASFVAQKGIPVILMHKRGIPSTMQKNTSYADVVAEVSSYLAKRAEYATINGISRDKIILDPGIGFGKDVQANFKLIGASRTLCNGSYPVLIGLSRKTCIGAVTGRSIEERLYGTLAADILAVQSGASFLRVHDVASCVDTLSVLKSFNEANTGEVNGEQL